MIVPLIFFAALMPNRAAGRDVLWPADEIRRQALVLLIVPLVLPAVINLVIPYRLTPDWTFSNWALLPLVLYGSPELVIDTGVAACWTNRVGISSGDRCCVSGHRVCQAHADPRPPPKTYAANSGNGAKDGQCAHQIHLAVRQPRHHRAAILSAAIPAFDHDGQKRGSARCLLERRHRLPKLRSDSR